MDVCTGTGDLAIAYWKASKGTSHIVAADFCREMLQIGQNKKTQFGINGDLTFVEADTQELPFPSGQFQIVSVAFGLRNVSDTIRGADRNDTRLRGRGQGRRIGVFDAVVAAVQGGLWLVLSALAASHWSAVRKK